MFVLCYTYEGYGLIATVPEVPRDVDGHYRDFGTRDTPFAPPSYLRNSLDEERFRGVCSTTFLPSFNTRKWLRASGLRDCLNVPFITVI